VKIYGDVQSGNCLKVKFLADYLNLDYEWVEIDLLKGETRSEEFLIKSPFGQVPIIELDGGRVIAQSNSILRFLSRGSNLLPTDVFLEAKVDEWLFWEQYSHEPYIAVPMFQMFYLKKKKEEREAWRVERGDKALDLLNQHLSKYDWLVGDQLTIADIALFAYTHRCHLGGFELETRPSVISWLSRCREELKMNMGSP
jgi:glutathione S-transferase